MSDILPTPPAVFREKLLNLTPHPVNIYDPEGKKIVLTYGRSGFTVRLESKPDVLLNPLLVLSDAGDVVIPVAEAPVFTGLRYFPNTPDTSGCDGIIVSMPVGVFLQERTFPLKVYVPDSGPGQDIRDADGEIIGVKRLRVYFQPFRALTI